MKDLSIIPPEIIQQKIYFVRGEKVMFDRDLAVLYGVTTKRLNEQVRRNLKRFPADFMFQLNGQEFEIWKSQTIISGEENISLRSQSATSKRGGRRYNPHVFTEQGVAMLSSVLNSERAIQVNIQVIRTFTRLRKILATHKELKDKLEKIEKSMYRTNEKNSKYFAAIFQTLKLLMKEDAAPKRKIGFEIAKK
jgi:phage regulator Rha-like protein